VGVGFRYISFTVPVGGGRGEKITKTNQNRDKCHLGRFANSGRQKLPPGGGGTWARVRALLEKLKRVGERKKIPVNHGLF